MTTPPESSFDALLSVVGQRLARNQRIRRNLPGGGRIRIDRQLPFLCLYRQPIDRDDAGTEDLITTEAAYVLFSGDDAYRAELSKLLLAIGETLREHFGVLLFLEVWSENHQSARTAADGVRCPAFKIITAEADTLPSTVKEFQTALEDITLEGRKAKVELIQSEHGAPPGFDPPIACDALAARTAAAPTPAGTEPDPTAETAARCFYIGLAVRAVYRDPHSGAVYPVLLQRLRRQLSRALRRAIFAFTGIQQADPRLHFDSLGPTELVKAARLVDQQLCDVSESFDFLLQATPVNSRQAWLEFAEGGCRETPTLHYRPLPYHPGLLKRQLFEIPIERIEDPTLALLCQQKQSELDRKLSALRDLDTPDFLYASLQLFGSPDADLLRLARRILEAPFELQNGDDDSDGATTAVTATEIADRARVEIDHYHSQHAGFSARVEVCDHIASGLMVARDRLFVSESCRIPPRRVEPLLHHEVGTHLLTYFNGRQQPFRQLYAGLPGYDSLQEGLAMFAELAVDGLTQTRLRTVAARVLAAQAVIDGRSFVDCFESLHHQFGVPAQSSFMITLRAYRGRGMTKDILYLRGFRDLLSYLRDGHDLEPLYVGKIGLEHVPLIQEFRRRGIIQPPTLLPRFWEEAVFRERLEMCRQQPLEAICLVSGAPTETRGSDRSGAADGVAGDSAERKRNHRSQA